MPQRLRTVWTILPAAGWLFLFLLVPIFIILFYSFLSRGLYGGIEYHFTLDNYKRLFDPLYFSTIFRSLKLAASNTLLCLALGYPLAYFISSSGKWKNILIILVVIPFCTNFLLRIYAWMIILGRNGFLNKALMFFGITEQPFSFLFSSGAVSVGLAYAYLPFMILPVYAALERMDRSLLDVSRDLGATPLQSFYHVVLPLTKSGIFAGSILVFIPSLGEFIIPDLLGGSNNLMIGNVIKDQYFSARDWPFGSAFGILIISCISLLLFLFTYYLSKDKTDSKGIL